MAFKVLRNLSQALGRHKRSNWPDFSNLGSSLHVKSRCHLGRSSVGSCNAAFLMALETRIRWAVALNHYQKLPKNHFDESPSERYGLAGSDSGVSSGALVVLINSCAATMPTSYSPPTTASNMIIEPASGGVTSAVTTAAITQK